MQAVANQFERSTLCHVSPNFHGAVVEKLPLDLPLELAGTAISDEAYWKHRSQSRWTNCDANKHGGSFKQLYFERNLQDTIEEYVLALVRHDADPACAEPGNRSADLLPIHVDLI